MVPSPHLSATVPPQSQVSAAGTWWSCPLQVRVDRLLSADPPEGSRHSLAVRLPPIVEDGGRILDLLLVVTIEIQPGKRFLLHARLRLSTDGASAGPVKARLAVGEKASAIDALVQWWSLRTDDGEATPGRPLEEQGQPFCRVLCDFRQTSGSIPCCLQVITDAPPEETPALKRHRHSAAILDLAKTGAFADCVLRSGGREIPCHRLVLAAQSRVFKTMLQSSMEESKTGEICISDLTESNLENFVDYLYGSKGIAEMAATLEDIKQILFVADRYELRDMREDCFALMTKRLTPATALEVAHVAKLLQEKTVRDHVVDFIAKNLTKFMEDKDLLKKLRQNEELDFEVLNRLCKK